MNVQKIAFLAYRLIVVPALIVATLFVTSHLGKLFASVFTTTDVVQIATSLPFWSAITGVLSYTISVCILLLTACLWVILLRPSMDDTNQAIYSIARLWKRIVWRQVCKCVVTVLACYASVSTIVTTVLYSMPHVERFEPVLSIAYNVEIAAFQVAILLFILLSVSKKGDK